MAADLPHIRSPPRNPAEVKAVAALVILVRAIGQAFRRLLLVAGDGCHRGLDENLLKLAGQVAAPYQTRRRGQRVRLNVDGNHIVGVGHPVRPGQCGRPP